MKNIFTQTALLFCLGMVAAAPASAVSDEDYQIYIWPKWQKGIELGGRALGRFGKGTNINVPPGDVYTQLSYHLWYNHLFDFHVNFGYGVLNSSMIYGAGTRLNLLEFVEDPTREMIIRGLQRGLLSNVVRNFMIEVGVEYVHFGFKEPTAGLSYDTSGWSPMPILGAQWFFYVSQSFAGRFYMESSIGYTKFDGGNYFMPLISFGAELL